MKKLTLILSMMIALIGLNANAAMYIVGDNPFGGWHTYAGEQMTDNGNGIYTYVTDKINGTVWFVFADNLTTGTSDDWGTFNGNYRYGPLNSGQAITAGIEYTTQKSTNGGVSYSFAGTAGESYQFTFDTNTMKFKIEGYVAPVEYTSFTVAGNDVDIFGEAWNPALTQNDMTLGEDGVYKLRKNGIQMTAGDTLEYKVVANHSWDYNWGETFNGENKKECFVEDGIYDITFFFDPKNEFVTISTSLIAPVEYTSFTVAGNNTDIFGEAWNPALTQNDMTLDPNDGVYKLRKTGIEIPADYTLEYKVAANHSWKFNWGETFIGDNKTEHFEQSGIYDMTFFFDLENEFVTISTVKVGELPEPTTDVYIIGDVDNIGWNATQGVKMTLNEGVYTANITTQNQGDLGIAYFGFTKKLAETNDSIGWASIAPFRFGPVSEGAFVMTQELLGNECTLATDGSYESIAIPEGTWTVTVDLVNNKFTINGEWPTDTITPEPEADVYILGDVNNIGWNATDGVKMTFNEGIYTANITTQNQGDLGIAYFGFTKKLAETNDSIGWASIAPFRFGPVSEGAFVMTEELLGNECSLATDGSYESIAIPEGTWTVTVDLVNNKFTINGEWPTDTITPEPEGNVYIIGEVNDKNWAPNDGVQMTFDEENNVYTATVSFDGRNTEGEEGAEEFVNYFGLTKKLGANDQDWATLNANRLGSETDGNYWVTPELMGQEIGLVCPIDMAYRIAKGEYTITVNLENMTMVINQAGGLRGDVDKSKDVTIADVSALIDYLLTGDASEINLQNADCDLSGNGTPDVTIADVSALIDYLLNGEW